MLGAIDRRRAPALIDTHSERRPEIVAEEHHDRANARLLLEILRDLIRLFARDAGNLSQPIGMIFDDVKGVLSKLIHNLLRRFGADALDGTGGQIAQNGVDIGRQYTLVSLDRKLSAVLGIMYPAAVDGHAVALGYIRQCALDGHKIVIRAEVADGIAIFLVGIDHPLDTARELLKSGILRVNKLVHFAPSFPPPAAAYFSLISTIPHPAP